MVVLCAVFFLLPFSLRGARMAVESMKNDVSDWLPGTYDETKDLGEFREYFLGDQFVLVSWPGCTANDSRYQRLMNRLKEESVDGQAAMNLTEEEIYAHKVGDEHGLHTTGNFHEDWGNHREKWLMGKNGQWYFINQKGELYRWDGQNNLFDAVKRSAERFFNGKNQATGKFIEQFGKAPQNQNEVNPYYANPKKLYARFFKRVTSGPEVFKLMAGENGVLKTGDYSATDAATFDVQVEAHRRLEGWLFGPTPRASFDWTWDSLINHVSDNKKSQLDDKRKKEFEIFVTEIEQKYGKNFRQKFAKDPELKLEIWYELWRRLQTDPPARQTCILVYLNDPILDELARGVGRKLLGKPRGRVRELASGLCGIDPENLHIGGPPADNVAIDEEGSITLLKLVSLSAIIGVGLAYLCFRSFKITIMLFFTGGVSAISSLALVHYAQSTLDAILMSMPSLIYVLGLSGAVHIVNYYRDACHENGEQGAAEEAIRLGWFPCVLAAFTTALGLVSLTTSYLKPISKFGLFSALATMATVIFLMTYLPASLHIWRPGYKKRSTKTGRSAGTESKFALLVGAFWSRVGDLVIKHYRIVCVAGIIVLIFFGYGVTRIETTVQLLKLFDKNAKILQDYRWLEDEIGRLVPMEILVKLDPSIVQIPPKAIAKSDAKNPADDKKGADGNKAEPEKTESQPPPELTPELTPEERLAADYRLNMLERLELSQRIRQVLENAFGPAGKDVVGAGMSTDVLVPMFLVKSQLDYPLSKRRTINKAFESHRDSMLRDSETLRVNKDGTEMWRISIRLAALSKVEIDGKMKDLDYGQFVSELKTVVEPILKAYEARNKLVKIVHETQGVASFKQGKILVLGNMPTPRPGKGDSEKTIPIDHRNRIDQSLVFANTFRDLLENQGYQRRGRNKKYNWLDGPRAADRNRREQAWRKQKGKAPKTENEIYVDYIKSFDYVVVTDHQSEFDIDLVQKHAKKFIDLSDYQFLLDPKTNQPAKGILTAQQRKQAGENLPIIATYTGIVPIVYKAQRSLLHSLINSICLAFVMIAIVMMLLLTNWKRPTSFTDYFNVPGGMLAMLPNVFPIVLIFGAMGHLGPVKPEYFLVDIGSMMTASVAMGVAVDDTIHFLNWYRKGLSQGMDRIASIKLAYERVATAMTQTTLIGGFGLFAFALSTFTPTQRFGTLMLFLLGAALIGDLIFLPALLASPLGKWFGKQADVGDSGKSDKLVDQQDDNPEATDADENSAHTDNGKPAEQTEPDDPDETTFRTDPADKEQIKNRLKSKSKKRKRSSHRKR